MDHLEGRLSVLAALEARQRRFQVILISDGAHEDKLHDLLDTAARLGVPVQRVGRAQLDAMAHGKSHGGVVAVCTAKPPTTPQQLLHLLDSLTQPPLLLLLEGIDDARNLGFTLRSAEALGVHAVLVKKHLWDFDAVEIARPASGAYERLPLVRVDDLELLKALRARRLRLLGCIASAGRTLYQTDLAGPTLLAIGGEKRGLSAAVRGLCDAFLSIPSAGGATSLPLSHAAAIALAEAMRQRGALK